jgi:hypothetical protein
MDEALCNIRDVLASMLALRHEAEEVRRLLRRGGWTDSYLWFAVLAKPYSVSEFVRGEPDDAPIDDESFRPEDIVVVRPSGWTWRNIIPTGSGVVVAYQPDAVPHVLVATPEERRSIVRDVVEQRLRKAHDAPADFLAALRSCIEDPDGAWIT